MKKLTVFVLLMIALFTASACFASTHTNDGMTLTIPDEYEEMLVLEMPENDAEGILFSVSEKASIEAAKAEGFSTEGAGWLFGIGRVSEEAYHEMLCSEVPGREVFAKDDNGSYYIYFHPTDVRVVRADYNDPAVWDEWGKLCEWGDSMKESFINENEGLTAEKHGNTILDYYISRLMYKSHQNYTVSTTEYGPMEAGRINAAVYLKPLSEGVVYEIASSEETPDGEYVVLNFPEEDIRFDFFLAEGKENYIRQVWFNGENEMLYKAVFDDPEIKASAVMHEFYLDLVLADSLGYNTDDLIGKWGEKFVGRCGITIEKDENDIYHISIHWASSAFESNNWTMTAVPTGNGSEIRYEDCEKKVITFTSETESTETIVYQNGTGTFGLLSTNELQWNDEVEHAADDLVFIK